MSAYVVYSRVAMIAVMGLIFHILPVLSRREIYFAVTVPGSFRDDDAARRILGAFRLQVWLHTAAAAALVWVASETGWTDILPLALLWPVIGFLVAFLMARHRVLPHGVSPGTMREAELTPRAIDWPGGWIGQLGPFTLLALVGAVMLIQWERLPELLPVHWGIDGLPDRWIEKTVPAVLGSLAMHAILCAMIAAFGYGILRHTRRIGGPGGEAERTFQRWWLRMLLGLEYYLVLTVGAVRLVPLIAPEGSALVPFLPIVATPFLLLALVVAFFRMGQGGSRLGPGAGDGGRPIGDRTPDACWKLGLFYVNHEDPALLVEKRVGIGYTLNFGHYAVWILMAGILGLPVLIRWLRSGGF